MEEFERRALEKMPLAEGVGWLWRFVLDEEFLDSIWGRFRGRCYTGVLKFSLIVQLIHDALLNFGSGRESFRKHQIDGTLEASLQATYGKLARLPVAVSQAMLSETTQKLRQLFPDQMSLQKPLSLNGLRVIIYDGKTIKRVAKRLKPCRGVPGGMLGGRSLVAIDWETGLAIAMRGDLDGDANEIKHVGELVPEVCRLVEGPRLHVGDRAFCDLEQPQHFTKNVGDHFLVRYHPKVKFHPDASKPAKQSVNEQGQTIIESWGLLGSPTDRRHREVRRIELLRADEDSIILITDLLDAEQFPATDLLMIYRERWQIEEIFQQVTEVFGLSHLIGCSPEASLFQFAFCLMLYNMIQLVRAYVAQTHHIEAKKISNEMMFRDVERELIAWNVMIPVDVTVTYFNEVPTLQQIKAKLSELFQHTWSDTWKACPHQATHNTTRPKGGRIHKSVFRMLYGIPIKPQRTNKARC